MVVTLSDQILVTRCMECGAVIGSRPANRTIPLGKYSDGYCADCYPAVAERSRQFINTMTTQVPGRKSDFPGDGSK